MMKVWYDGYELTELCKVKEISRDILPPRQVRTLSVPTRDGAYFTGMSYDSREISIDIAFKALNEKQFMLIMRKLAFWLDSREPTTLSFSDEPDKEYYAILTEKSSIKEMFSYGEGTLTFLCADPFAYATTEKIYRPKTSAFAVENKGTTSTYPTIYTKILKDTDFVWYQSNNGGIMLGEPSHVDKENVPREQYVFYEKCNTTSGWVGHNQFDSYITANNVFKVDAKLDGFVPNAYGTPGSGTGWHGAGMRKSLSEDISDFKCSFNFWLTSQDGTNALDGNQKGRIEIYGFANDGTKLFKVVMRDSYVYHEFNIPEMYIGESLFLKDEPQIPKPKITYQKKKDKKGKWVKVKKTIPASHVGKWNDIYGVFYISRVNNVWSFKLDKLSKGKVIKTLQKSYNDSGGKKYGNKQLSYIAMFMGKYKNDPPVRVMSITHATVKKVNQKTTIYNEDIFTAGDKIEVDCATGEVYVNEELRLDIVDPSTTFFDIDVGKTMIQQKTDGSIETEVRFKERWL